MSYCNSQITRVLRETRVSQEREDKLDFQVPRGFQDIQAWWSVQNTCKISWKTVLYINHIIKLYVKLQFIVFTHNLFYI